MNYEKTLELVREHVLSLFKTRADDRLTYHNAAHTQSVVSYAIQIADHYQLNDDDFFAVCAAAWFHDSGYMLDLHNHEDKSIEIAREFFSDHHIKAAVLDRIIACIEATKIPQNPKGLLENILCDADLFHLGTDDFTGKSKQLRQEVEALHNTRIDRAEWRQRNIDLLEGHRYHTDYCRLLLHDRLQENLNKLRNKQQKTASKEQRPVPETQDTPPGFEPAQAEIVNIVNNAPHLKVKKDKKRSKGVETMLRITASNQQRLSNMADSKAHIMISVNSIIISLLLSLLLRKIDEHPNQLIPAIILLGINLVTIVFAILATRPNVTQGTFTGEEVKNRKVNLMFFGNFFKMPFDDYEAGMNDMMNDNNFLYGSMVKDMYSQGVVLGRKYHLLRMSYNVFMYGLVISVVAFVISTLAV
ncbi:phosphohydrolase [Mucilaginibacter sp. PPCGB 2223]|uniref:Pycsar system effector family protein n=1 Tax=Mucilaginibacter sp. PPCGB 2223 TaxID=1886027 RepID=UPI000824428B|nr:Pycsar system effector family protein [Mucilaginibacter sp. PPCGB 2223]OCX54402.1 phosphohydrolase [Mucilaginibacter sp. PPCGB 2223]